MKKARNKISAQAQVVDGGVTGKGQGRDIPEVASAPAARGPDNGAAGTPSFAVRSGQREFERGVDVHRISGFLCRRQYGKTTTAGRIALKKMMRTAGHTVVFGSVKLDLGREIVRKESAAMQKAVSLMMQAARTGGLQMDVIDAQGGKSVAAVNADDWAELYEATRLEFRLWHDRTVYSRTKVVALTPDAVGETGDLILDEVGRVKNFREVWEAVKPIISSNPAFRCLLTTTPPPDDTHFSFELLAPPIGTEFPINPKGNWYQSELGVWILRVDAADAFADGIPLYDDDTGKPQSPEESRAREFDKDAWDRNYGVKFVLGGTAAVGLVQLDHAMRKGAELRCAHFSVTEDVELAAALEHIRTRVGDGRIGIGVDWATTEKDSSNPTAVAVVEERGAELVALATLTWKTADPKVAIGRLRQCIQAVNGRQRGGRARRVCQDATSERYHCVNVRRDLGTLCPIQDVVGSETVEQTNGEKATRKAILGAQLAGLFTDNRIAIPADRYVKDDVRRVKRHKGSFDAELGPNGEHGDVFDALKLAAEAVTSNAGAITTMEGIAVGTAAFRPAVYRPAMLKGGGQ
jgi:hypothetical protein